ncbi:fibronectin type III domain-containing protein [Geomonas sp.]|uniref:fibronectin type III domain-containing protein n=1 Tax=Geomonas sp. TaxID=2651584 RepID=UPI002B4695F6|nr:fibronectin type III domain-containing protein [Geomonas sp.]HJV35199.1 fibronectin type III domain-containing protein [Geomonas sp.]
MKNLRVCIGLVAVLFSLVLGGCSGDSPWRYNPGIPSAPTGLTATPGGISGQVFLTWNSAQSPTPYTSYTVYYSTSPQNVKSGTRIASLTGTSFIVTGLTNDVTYYFAVTASTSSGESPLSAVVAAAPSAPGAFQQSDLQGTWYFNAVQRGAGARWMKGAVVIDGMGNVAVGSYVDSTGFTSAPPGLFNPLSVLPDGKVVQAQDPDFHAVLSANQFRDFVVGTTTVAGSPVMLVLQKRVPGVAYSPNDIKGTGKAGAGPLLYNYHQISSGVSQEWQTGSCQVGQDQAVTYLSITAPSTPPLPGAGDKVLSLSITLDGLVSETPTAGVVPQPSALFTNQVMSADKMTLVGTATDASGAFVLRIVQLIHPPAQLLTAANYTSSGLAGSYVFHDLVGAGATSLWARGDLAIDAAGVLGVSTYLDSSGNSAFPAPLTVAMDSQGLLTAAGNPTFNGQLSYFNDMMISTRTDAGGNYRFSIALKR